MILQVSFFRLPFGKEIPPFELTKSMDMKLLLLDVRWGPMNKYFHGMKKNETIVKVFSFYVVLKIIGY